MTDAEEEMEHGGKGATLLHLNVDVPLLKKFATALRDPHLTSLLLKMPYSFCNVTQLFRSSNPLLKFTDAKSGWDVDLCINNHAVTRKSALLRAYAVVPGSIGMSRWIGSEPGRKKIEQLET